jgi:hypothetical protein
MSTVHSSIDHHPDLLALRQRYERAAESMTAHGTFGFTLLTAVYAAVSPWVIGFGDTRSLVANDFIVGIVCVALAFVFAMALDRSHGMTWTLPVLGLWVIVSPWILRGLTLTAGMIWSNVVAGVVLACLGMTATYFGMRTRTATKHA